MKGQEERGDEREEIGPALAQGGSCCVGLEHEKE